MFRHFFETFGLRGDGITFGALRVDGGSEQNYSEGGYQGWNEVDAGVLCFHTEFQTRGERSGFTKCWHGFGRKG